MKQGVNRKLIAVFQMSKFSQTSNDNFSFVKREDIIREIARSEVYAVLTQIKGEIENKIKQIDRNISELRRQVAGTLPVKNDLSQILRKIDRIEVQIQGLKYVQQQSTLKMSRTNSFQKDRKPIFKKSQQQSDLNCVILGLDSMLVPKSIDRPASFEPPTTQMKGTKEGAAKVNYWEEADSVKMGNPEQDSVNKLLKNNPTSAFSCLDGIIQEEDIQESHYF